MKCKPPASRYLDVGVVLARGAPLASAALLLAVLVKLRVAEDGHSSALVNQSQRSHAVQALFVSAGHGKHHRNRQVDDATCGDEEQSWFRAECK